MESVKLTLAAAIDIATRAHAGQMDKNGVTPYIEHPLAVMAMVDGEDAKIVAVLHDVLEDTSVKISDLALDGATVPQMDALLALTRRADEPYAEYIQRALNNPLARVVKIADYDHNSDPARLAMLVPVLAERLRKKYARVAPFIDAARTTQRKKSRPAPNRATERRDSGNASEGYLSEGVTILDRNMNDAPSPSKPINAPTAASDRNQ